MACCAAVAERSARAVLTGDDRVAVEPHEPLRGGEKDHRVVAAPAVRVLVRERLAVPQTSTLVQRLLDLRIGVEHPLAAEQLHRVQEVPAWIRPAHRSRARTSCRSGSRLHRDPARYAPRPFPAPASRTCRARRPSRARRADDGNGCLRACSPVIRASCRSNGFPTAARHACGQPFRDDHGASVDVVGGVLELRMEGDRQVRRNRPGSRRPDEDRHRAPGERRDARAEFSRRSPAPAGTPRRSTATNGRRTRLPLRPARCGSGCTSGPASCPCRRGPARRTVRARGRCPPGTRTSSSGTDDPSRRTRRAAGTPSVMTPMNRSA